MKKCNNCSQNLPDNVLFCPECGTKLEAQLPTPPTTPNTTPPQPPPADTAPPQPQVAQPQVAQTQVTRPQGTQSQAGTISPDVLGKASYAGAVLVILSPFLPMISVLGGLGSFSISEISGLVTAAIALFAVIALYFHAQGQVDIMPVIGTGLLLLLAVGFLEYHSTMDEVSQLLGSTGKAAAKAAFSFSAGFYAFTGGSILMCIGGSGCLAHKLGVSPDFSGILKGWKEALQRTIVLGSLQLPGWIFSIIVTGILGLLIKNIKL